MAIRILAPTQACNIDGTEFVFKRLTVEERNEAVLALTSAKEDGVVLATYKALALALDGVSGLEDAEGKPFEVDVSALSLDERMALLGQLDWHDVKKLDAFATSHVLNLTERDSGN